MTRIGTQQQIQTVKSLDILDVMRLYPELNEEINKLIQTWIKSSFGPKDSWTMQDELDRMVTMYISKKRDDNIDELLKR